MKRIRLLGISPYDGMKDLMLNIAQQRNDIELTAFVGDLQEGVNIVEQNLTPEINGIVSRGGTAEMIRAKFAIPVTEIHLTVYDILRAMRLAQTFSEKFAIVGFHSVTTCARPLCDLMKMDIPIVTVHSAKEAEGSIDQLRSDGYHVILGDMITATKAQQQGMNGILITSGVESIQDAFSRASQLCASYIAMKTQATLLETMMKTDTGFWAAYREDGEFCQGVPGEPDEPLRTLLKQNIPTVISKGYLSLHRRQEDTLLSVMGNAVRFEGENLCVYRICYLDAPIPQDGGGVEFYHVNDQPPFDDYFGTSELMQTTQRSAEAAASFPSFFLLDGEQGTPLADMAFHIHRHAKQSAGTFVLLDCQLISQKTWDFLLMDCKSPLFSKKNTLCFKRAELLAAPQQEALVAYFKEAMENGNRLIFLFQRGENRPTLLEQRLQAAFCRTLRLPPLREYSDDIPGIAAHYVNMFNVQLCRQVLGFDPAAQELIRNYRWPGNIDQLKRVIRDLTLDSKSSYISAEEVKRAFSGESRTVVPDASVWDLNRPLSEITRDIVLAVVQQEHMNQTRAAKKLGISRSTLWRILSADQ